MYALVLAYLKTLLHEKHVYIKNMPKLTVQNVQKNI